MAYNPKKDYEKNKKKYDYSGMFSNDDSYNPRRDYFENSDRFDYKGFNLDIKLNDLDKERKKLNSFIEGSSDRFRSDEELEQYNELSRKYRQSAMALKNEIQGEKYGAFDRDSEDYKNLMGDLDSISSDTRYDKALKGIKDYYEPYMNNPSLYDYEKKKAEKNAALTSMSDEELNKLLEDTQAEEEAKSLKNVNARSGKSWADYFTNKDKENATGYTTEELKKYISDREQEKYLSSLTEEDKELARTYKTTYKDILNTSGVTDPKIIASVLHKDADKQNDIKAYFESKGLDADKVADYVQMEDDAKRQAERDAETKAFMDEGTGAEVLANVGTVASSPIRGLIAIPGMVASTANSTGRYDVNNNFNSLSNFADTVKETTKEKHDWETELFGKNVDLFDKIYDFSISSAESLTTSLLGVGVGGIAEGAGKAAETVAAVIGTIPMGTDAMVSQTKQLTEAGADRDTALLGGLVAGSFEVFFEHFSVQQLGDQINARTLKEVATEFGKSIGINASEETFTEIANILYDTLANGGASEYTQLYNSYMAQGMSEDEARSQAIKDLVGQVFESGAQGGLMGGLFGGVGTGIGSVNAVTEAKTSGAQIKTNQEKIAAMVNNGLNAVEGSEPYKIAQRIKEKAYNEETGEYDVSKIKDYEIGNLAYNLTSDTYANKIISEKEKGAEVEDKVKGVMDTYKTMAGVKENVATSKENYKSVDFNKGTAVTEDGKTVDLNKTGISRSLSAFEVLTKKLSTEETNKLYSAYKSLKDKSKVSELVTAYEWAKNGGAKLKEYSNTDALQVAYNLGKEQNLVDFSQKKTKIFNPSEVVETMSAEDLKAFNDFIHQQEGMENVNVEALDDAYFDNLIKRIESGDKQAQAEADRISAATDLAKMLNDFGFNYSFSFYRTKDSDVRNGKGVNGNVNLSTGKIYVDVNAGNVGQNMILQAMAHEMAHLAKEQTPKEWNEFAKAILEETNNYTSEEYKEKGDYLKRILGETISKYQDKKGNIKMELLTDEVVAKLAEGMLTDERVFERIVETNRSLAQRIVDFLKSILKQLKAAFKGTEYASEIKYTQDVINKFVDMLNARKEVSTEEVSINKNTVRDLVNAVNIADLSVKENLTDEVNKYLFEGADNLNAISDIVEKNVREEVENPDYTEVRNIVNQGRWYVPEKTRNNVKDSVGNEYSAISARLNLTSDNKATSYEIMLRELAEQNAALDFEGEEEAIIDLNEWLINNAEKYEKVTPEMAKMYAEEFIDNLKALKDGRTEDVRFSMRDSDGNTLTKEQAEFFKDSKARDEDGNLLVMYHGTENAGFTVFDSKYSDDELSLFFTNELTVAKGYSDTYDIAEHPTFKTTKEIEDAVNKITTEEYKIKKENGIYKIYAEDYMYGERVGDVYMDETANIGEIYDLILKVDGRLNKKGNYKVYLNLTNPLYIDGKGNNWDELEVDFADEVITTREAARYAYDNGYDGVILDNINDTAMYNDVEERFTDSKVMIAFDSNQIKLTSNKKPTENEDIRFSKRDSEGRELTKGQQEYYKDNSVESLDKDGNLKRYYHGTDYFFTKFNLKRMDDGSSIFLTDNKQVAASYTNSGLEEEFAPDKPMSFAELYDLVPSITQGDYLLEHEAGNKFAITDVLGEDRQIFNTLDEVRDYVLNNYIDEYEDDNSHIMPLYAKFSNPLVVNTKGRSWNDLPPTDDYRYKEYWDVAIHKTEDGYVADYFPTRIADMVTETFDSLEKLSKKFGKITDKDFEYNELYLGNVYLSKKGNRAFKTTREYSEYAKNNGYDAVVFNGIYDEGFNGKNETPSQVVVVFNPNQAKSIYNENPTENEDIRFSMREPIEETEDLIAVHNLSEEKLIEAIKLGGFAFPSVAIIKASMGHLHYGDYSVLFYKDSIDPKKSSKNRIYGGDAWTPTFPSIEVKINSKVAEKIRQHIRSVVSDEEEKSFGYLALDNDNLQDSLNRFKGDAVDAFQSSKTIQYAFLKEKGIKLNIPYEDARLNRKFTNEQVIAASKVIKDLKQAEELRTSSDSYKNNPEIVEELRKALNEQFKSKYVKTKADAKIFDKDLYEELSFNDFDNLTAGIYKYYKDGITKQLDEAAAREIVGKKIKKHKSEYLKWLNDLFKGIIEKKGLRNNKDLFTYSGNRRSWDALHDDYTLDNVVRIMSKEDEKGVSFFTQAGIQALSTRTFNNLIEVRKHKDQLRSETEKEHEERIEKQSQMFSEICTEIMDTKESNPFIAFGRASEAIEEAVRKYKTVEGIDKELRQWHGLNIKDDTAKKIVDLMNEIKNNPTEYFEAKLRRAVGLNEIAKVIVPDNASKEIIELLNENNIPYDAYKNGDDEARLEALNAVEGARFSKHDSQGNKLTDNQAEYFKNSKVVDEGGNLMPLYHTGNEVFTRFNTSGIWLAEDKNYSLQYGNTVWKRNNDIYDDNELAPQLYEDNDTYTMKVYANIVNPLDTTKLLTNSSVYLNDSFAHNTYEGLGIKDAETFKRYRKLVEGLTDNQARAWELFNNAEFHNLLKELGYDGIKAVENIRLLPANEYNSITWCAFYPEQVKLTSNENPTSNEDIRYSKRNSELATNRELVAGVIKQLAKNDKENKSLNSYVANIDEITKALDRVDEINLELSKSWLHRNEAEEAKNIQKLSEEKEKLLDKVARQDKKLMSLESTAFMKDLLSREKEKAKKRTAAKYRQYFEDYKMQKKTTVSKQAIRNRIIRQVKSVNKRLVNWTDKNNVKADIQPLMVGFVRSFLNDTSVFEKAKLADLQAAYERMAADNSDNILLGRFYDPDTNEELIELRELLDDKRLSQLTLAEHERVADIVEHFLHVIKNYDEIFTQGKRATVESVASSWMADMSDKEHKASGLTDVLEKFGYANMTPIYLFKRLGNTAYKLYNDFLDAQDRNMVLADEAHNRLNAIADKYHYYDWNKQKDTLSFVTEEGSNIELTLGQAMTLYATAKREATSPQEAKHLSHGGFVYPEKKKALKRQRTDARAHRLSEADNVRIADWLTPEQRGFVDAIVEYMSTDMSELGNEVAMKLFGITKYNEKYYFPYNVDSNTLQTSSGGVPPKQENAIKHVGFTKATVRGANKPIVIDDFFDIATNHINQMITYASWAVPLDSFNAVLNYRTTPTADTPGVYLKAEIENAFGKNMLKAINQVLVDINGGIRISEGEKFANSLIGMFKSQAVLMSASVVVQQPSAIGRAFALIDGKYFFGSHPSLKAWEECKEYCPVARIKEIGKYDTYTGKSMADYIKSRDLKGKEFVKALFEKDNSARQDLMGIAPQYADIITWSHIWNAVKAEVRDKQGLSGEELRQAAAVRFREVINLTQVYDSTLAKSSWMRSKSGYMKMITAFGAEPTLSFNLLIDGILSKKAKVASRAIGAFVLSVAFNALLKSLITAARDDDDDKTYLEKYIGNLFGNFLDDVNPASLVPIFRDVVSLIQGYDVNRADMEAISMFIDMVKTVADSDKGWEEKIAAIMDGAGVAFGVPVRNVRRDVKALINVINSSPISETTLKGVDESIKEELRMDTSLKSTYEKMLDSGNVEKYAEDIEYQYLKKLKKAKGSSQSEKAKNARSSIKTSATSYFLGEYKKAYAEGNTDRCNEILSVVRQIKVAGIRLYDSGFEKTWKKKAQEAMSEE